MSKKSAIRMVTPVKDLGKYLGEELEKDQRKIATMLTYVGERCVIEMRTNGSYTDRTGNLRNSGGYVVLLNGRVFSEKRSERPETQSVLAEAIPKFQNGVALIVATGMGYGGYVEAKGFNVITSSRLLAQKLVPQMLTQLGFSRQ